MKVPVRLLLTLLFGEGRVAQAGLDDLAVPSLGALPFLGPWVPVRVFGVAHRRHGRLDVRRVRAPTRDALVYDGRRGDGQQPSACAAWVGVSDVYVRRSVQKEGTYRR